MGGRVMKWREKDGVAGWRPALPGCRGRLLDPLRPARSKESHEPLASALGIAAERIASAHQVHGAELAFHAAPATAEARTPLEVDGHVIDRARPGRPGLHRRLPAGRRGRAGRRRDAALRLARLGRRDRRPRRRGGRRDPRARDRARDRALLLEVGDEVLERVRRARRGGRRGPDARPARGRPAPAAPGRRRGDRVRRPLHLLRGGAVLLPPPRRGSGPPGGPRLDRGRAS